MSTKDQIDAAAAVTAAVRANFNAAAGSFNAAAAAINAGKDALAAVGVDPGPSTAQMTGVCNQANGAIPTLKTMIDGVAALAPDPDPVPDPPPRAQLVHPMAGLTDAGHIDMAMSVRWQKPCGDWLDKDGTLNGPNPTWSGTGTTATVDVSTVDDVMIAGPNSITQVLIDGRDVTAQCFWTSPDTNHSIALPSKYYRPVIVPDPIGKELKFVTAGGSWRVDPLALPRAEPPALVSGYTPPNVLRINPTSFDAVVIPGSVPAASTDANRCFAGAVTYEMDRGVPFAKAHCPELYYPTVGKGRVVRCDYPIPPVPNLFVAYMLYIPPGGDIWDATIDLGVKLSGMGGNETRWFCGEHSGKYYTVPKNARNRPIMTLRDYYFSAEATAGQGEGNGQQSPQSFGFLREGWNLIENGAISNTWDSAGVANKDGRKQTWLNGTMVEDRLIAWFSTPGSLWHAMTLQIYHGGNASYLKDCWYGAGPIMCSTQHIGVDPAFEPLISG